MFKPTLIFTLYKLGVHIGSYLTSLHQHALDNYILGRRYDFDVIDLQHTYIFLKKAVAFVDTLASNNGNLLFYYSDLYKLDYINKCFFVSLLNYVGRQQLITYRWLNGVFNNFYLLFYDIIKDITLTWFSNYQYIYAFDKDKHPYWSNKKGNLILRSVLRNARTETGMRMDRYIDKVNYNNQDFSFLRNIVLSRNRRKPGVFIRRLKRRNRLVRAWYKRWWARDSLATQRYLGSTRVLMNVWSDYNFFRNWCMKDMKNHFWLKQYSSFKNILIKTFYFLDKKKKEPFEAHNIHPKELINTDPKLIHPRFNKYWRYLLYFKYFNSYYNVPDALCAVLPNGDYTPSNEFVSCGLASIAIVDSDFPTTSYTYPILSNNSSMAIVAFYFTLFINLYIQNTQYLYHFIIHDSEYHK